MSLARKWLVFLGLAIALVAFALESPAQSHEGFIYGKVTTDRTTFTGPIRWGGEEVFWTDIFNAAKRNNDYAKLVPKEGSDKDWWSSYNWTFSSIWEDKGTSHQFVCQFGNIKAIENTGHRYITLKLKNGGELQVDGEGYNDIGSDIQILDEELGTINIKWANIRRVEFMETPSRLPEYFGQPLYGTVEGGRREKYTGFIVWDNDERLASDKLDGDSDDGKLAIRFAEIQSIEKSGNGCNVTLRSGRSFFLDDSNDVNNGNRGVFVMNPEYGIIKFSWRAFRRLTLATPPHSGQKYSDFPTPKPMQATVTLLDGGEVSGRIIYDIDEALDFELIEGKENDIEYQIPIQMIKRITPQNFDYSKVELRSGQTLLMGGMRDVSDENSGLLVFAKGKKEPVHVPWKKINEIIFD